MTVHAKRIRKLKPPALPPRPKRKRARAAPPPAEAQAEKPLLSDALIESVDNFIRNRLLPRLQAEIARRLGAPDARPRDFYCGCKLSALDGLPVCEEKTPGCRFAGRCAAEEMDAHESLEIGERHSAVKCEVVNAYRGPRGPAEAEAFRASPPPPGDESQSHAS